MPPALLVALSPALLVALSPNPFSFSMLWSYLCSSLFANFSSICSLVLVRRCICCSYQRLGLPIYSKLWVGYLCVGFLNVWALWSGQTEILSIQNWDCLVRSLQGRSSLMFGNRVVSSTSSFRSIWCLHFPTLSSVTGSVSHLFWMLWRLMELAILVAIGWHFVLCVDYSIVHSVISLPHLRNSYWQSFLSLPALTHFRVHLYLVVLWSFW